MSLQNSSPCQLLRWRVWLGRGTLHVYSTRLLPTSCFYLSLHSPCRRPRSTREHAKGPRASGGVAAAPGGSRGRTGPRSQAQAARWRVSGAPFSPWGRLSRAGASGPRAAVLAALYRLQTGPDTAPLPCGAFAPRPPPLGALEDDPLPPDTSPARHTPEAWAARMRALLIMTCTYTLDGLYIDSSVVPTVQVNSQTQPTPTKGDCCYACYNPP